MKKIVNFFKPTKGKILGLIFVGLILCYIAPFVSFFEEIFFGGFHGTIELCKGGEEVGFPLKFYKSEERCMNNLLSPLTKSVVNYTYLLVDLLVWYIIAASFVTLKKSLKGKCTPNTSD